MADEQGGMPFDVAAHVSHTLIIMELLVYLQKKKVLDIAEFADDLQTLLPTLTIDPTAKRFAETFATSIRVFAEAAAKQEGSGEERG